MKIRRSLGVRIAVLFILAESLLLALVLWQTQNTAFESVRERIADQDRLLLEIIDHQARDALQQHRYASLTALMRNVARDPHVRDVRLYGPGGEPLASSGHAREAGAGYLADSYLLRRDIGGREHPLGRLVIRFSRREIDQARHDALWQGVTIAVAGTLVTALVALWLGHMLSRRLRGIITETRRFADGDLRARSQPGGNDEITELGHAFNHMARQIGGNLRHIRHMAYHDSLTGLANRLVFHERLEQAVRSAQGHRHQHALLYLDLDQFKIINDTCGHDAGDALLVEITRAIAEHVRTRDTIARLGGDEFGLLLENCDLDEARNVAEKICHAVADYRFQWNARTFRIGVSIGVVAIDDHSPSAKRLLSLADLACYAAKESGRNTIRVATPQDDELGRRTSQMQWIGRLQEAMETRAFTLHRQAIANAADTRRRPFMELLVRLRDPDGGLIRPEEFIPAAERFRLMPAIDMHILGLCLDYLSGLPEDQRPQMSFINLSGQSLVNDKLPTALEQRLKQYDLPPSSLCFEITETAAIDNIEQANRFIESIQALGCNFALDDFGSGMCSFTYLKQLRTDFVKIDGSFIRRIAEDGVDQSIVASINTIAHQAGLRTIAEWVEDETTLALVRELGVDFVQGDFIDRPHDTRDAEAAQASWKETTL